MTTHLPVILACCSVLAIAAVNAIAAALGPDQAQALLLLCGVVAVGSAVQSVRWSPAALTSALFFSLPPVIGLLAGDSPAWLIGPVAVLLLVGSELNVLSWQCRGRGPTGVLARRRLLNIGQLGALGLVASFVVSAVVSGPSPGGIAAVMIAAAALAAVARMTFGRHS